MISTLPRRLKTIALANPYTKLVEPLLPQNYSAGKRFVNNAKVSDHHAIIPTEEPPRLQTLSHDEQRVYDLIVRRFIAVLYPPYQYDQTTIVTAVNGERFFARGNVVKAMGWKAVEMVVKDEGNDNNNDVLPDQTLTQQQQGDRKPVKHIAINQSKTGPPVRYTEATLLTAMESPGKFIEDEELRESIKAGGLGTPATRAEIIEKLLSNYYLERHGKSLVPTSKAFQLLELVPEALKSAELTAKWELRLSHIAAGQENRNAFMADIRQNASELVNSVRESTATYTPENLTQTKCPMCGQYMLMVQGRKGRKKLLCSDRRCGYEQSEEGDSPQFGKRSKKERQMNQRLIRKYSDREKTSTSLGELLKAALENKEEEV
jgi:DNA topoisomerase-3